MKILKEFVILCACLLIGSILKYLIPLPIPDTIYGMAILFILFITKKIKTDDVRRASNVILDNMSFLFVPVGVGIIENFDLFTQNFVAMFVVTIIACTVAMAVTMIVVEFVQKRSKHV
ncbi:CidA/LrgA family protein [uncultured Anaerococcus sp.]|uniref:CidA/LrgA family protein n=1 Tax=Anaerococcus sp. AH8042_DFU013_CI05 TaxID=3385202 RepID=UPI0025D166D3|nr:CidA/LrgA family protein [uncultured Anaerococcus sp.]